MDSSQVADTFTGTEAHACMIHHWLNQRFVWAIPDLWLILLAGAIAKASGLFQKEKPQDSQHKNLGQYQNVALYWLYGWVCLEAYLSLGLLVPFLLPSLAFYWLTRHRVALSSP